MTHRLMVTEPDARAIADACDFVHISGHDYLETMEDEAAKVMLHMTRWHEKSTYELAQRWYAFQAYSTLSLNEVYRGMGEALLSRVPAPIPEWKDSWRYRKLFPHLAEALFASDRSGSITVPVFSDWWYHLKPTIAPSKRGLKLYECDFCDCHVDTCCVRHPELLDDLQARAPPELLHQCMMFSQCYDDAHDVATVEYTLSEFRQQLACVMDMYVTQLSPYLPVDDLCRMVARYAL
jgi:hypothetical protein